MHALNRDRLAERLQWLSNVRPDTRQPRLPAAYARLDSRQVEEATSVVEKSSVSASIGLSLPVDLSIRMCILVERRVCLTGLLSDSAPVSIFLSVILCICTSSLFAPVCLCLCLCLSVCRLACLSIRLLL